MPRFTAIVRTAYGEIGPDCIEASDLRDAIAAARRFGEELAAGALRDVRCSRGWHVRLCDEDGAVVGAVLLAGLRRSTGRSARFAR